MNTSDVALAPERDVSTSQVALEPEQAEPVRVAVARLLFERQAAADAWWRAGVAQALYGDAAAPPRSSRGAERA